MAGSMAATRESAQTAENYTLRGKVGGEQPSVDSVPPQPDAFLTGGAARGGRSRPAGLRGVTALVSNAGRVEVGALVGRERA